MLNLQQAWYKKSYWPHLLRPVSAMFGRLSKRRRQRLVADAWKAPVPVIIVGNISVGGSGKTPLTLALINELKALGYKPGVVSRGYGAEPPHLPLRVTAKTLAREGGDEPCLIVRRTGVPLYIDPDRVSAVKALLSETDCDVVISDDGLQHYRLGRDIEICVIDGRRGLGNGCLLPEGPLREPISRLQEVDLVVVNGHGAQLPALSVPRVDMTLAPDCLVPLIPPFTPRPFDSLNPKQMHAVAGIGDPSRFFDTLKSLYTAEIMTHPLQDHAAVTLDMIKFKDNLPVLFTEKDWVKLTDQLEVDLASESTAYAQCWALTVEARLGQDFKCWLRERLAAVES